MTLSKPLNKNYFTHGNPETQVSDEKERIAEDEFQHFCDNLLNTDKSKYFNTIGKTFYFFVKLYN